MVDHLQSRVMPWPQYASHVKVCGTSSKMDVFSILFCQNGLTCQKLLTFKSKHVPSVRFLCLGGYGETVKSNILS